MIHSSTTVFANRLMTRLYHNSYMAIRTYRVVSLPSCTNQGRPLISKRLGNSCIAVRLQSHATKKNSFIKITPQSLFISSILTGMMIAVCWWLERTKQLRKSQERISALSESGLGTLNWTLTDQCGKQRTFSEFRGQWLMLYFGFCHCPDICPEELEKLIDVVKGIDSHINTPDIQPIFITLDPGRDTVQYMHKYCKDFSPKLIGFTGTTKEIAQVAKSYKVYYNLGAKDSDGDYIVDHTICMYLINPDGQLVDVYERRAKVGGIVKGSLEHINDYLRLKNRFGVAK